MNTTDRQKDIVTAAFTLISGQGIQELTIKKIALAIGVSEPAIYRHFDSKAAILEAILEEMLAARNGTMAAIRAEKGEPPAMLARFFGEQAHLFTTNPSLTIMLFPEDIFRNNTDLQERINAMMTETRVFIQNLLKAGITDGKFRREADPESMSLMLIGGFRMLVSSWRLQSHDFNLEKKTKQFIASVLPLIVRK